MNEIWKDIIGYEGLYQVSNLGRVKSFDRLMNHPSGGFSFKKGRILKNGVMKNGYCFVVLVKDGIKTTHYVHRIVAIAFIPNPNNLPTINHKDENKANNCVWVNDDGTVDLEKSNLEWCTHRHNVNCYWNKRRNTQKSKRALLIFDGKHTLGTYYRNMLEAAADLNISPQTISNGLHNLHKSRKGYSYERA